MSHHPMFGSDPGPFNLKARPGFGKELSKRYRSWSEANPNHTRVEGMSMHKQIAKEIEGLYPTHEELMK